MLWLSLLPLLVAEVTPPAAAQPLARLDSYLVASEFQGAPTRVEVLAPTTLEPGRRYPVLYVLPVEPGTAGRWGDAVAEAVKLDLANRHQALVVFPTFERTPWFADHPTDPSIRQESHFLKVVLPLVEGRYPTSGRRLLVGYSKSGYGAWCLLLRHPELFERAAAWDSPFQTPQPNRYEMGPIFGTQANFEQYRVPRLLAERAALLAGAPRLILMGHGNFRGETVATHEQLVKLGIGHVYRDGPQRVHHWQSGWLGEACEALFAP